MITQVASSRRDRIRAMVLLCCGMLCGCAQQSIHQLAAGGSAESLSAELTRDPAIVSARDKYGATPLMHAVAAHDVEAVRELLARGADVDLRDKKGMTAILYARGAIAEYAPDWRDAQEAFMRRQNLSEAQIREQLAKIDAAHTPAARQQWQTILAMLIDGHNASVRSTDHAALTARTSTD